MTNDGTPEELLASIDPAPWMRRGACRGANDDLWFPEQGQSPARAKAICATCPVDDDCLAYALRHRITDGVWGGTSTTERRRLIAALPHPTDDAPQDQPDLDRDAPIPLEACICGQHTECPNDWHHDDELPCSCTPDCCAPAELDPHPEETP